MGSRSKPTNSNFIIGVSLPDLIGDAATSLRRAREDGFDYVITSLPNTSGSLESTTSNRHREDVASIRTDVTQLESKWWSTSIVGIVDDPIGWKTDKSTTTAKNDHGRRLVHALTSYYGVNHLECNGGEIPHWGRDKSNNFGEMSAEANKIFWGMLEWASHMNIPAVILPSIPDLECEKLEPDGKFVTIARTNINCKQAKEYARLLANVTTSPICASSQVKLWVRVPLQMFHLQAFQLLLARCDHAPCIGCLLHIDRPVDAAELPNILRELHPFLGGGLIKAISWDTSVFLKNKKGFPTLSKSHQFLFSFLYGRLGRTLRTLVEGNGVDSSMQWGGSSSRLFILQYLRHLRSRDPLPDKLDSEEAVLETSYLDTLQSPLQPLGDHLEYQTYETFEKDPVKYKRYGEAIENALIDGMLGNKFNYSGKKNASRQVLEEMDFYEVTILVVGAGRGPLVNEAIGAVARASASLAIAPRTALHANIIAIEKNPSAVLYLHSLKGSNPSWNDGKDPRHEDDMFDPNDDGNIAKSGTSNVTVICCDMREATSHPTLRNMITEESCRADIVVSELLGSFGDNELSPECLDGVQKCGVLKDCCVSIPQRYVAVLCSPCISIALSLSHPVPISCVICALLFVATLHSSHLFHQHVCTPRQKFKAATPSTITKGPHHPPWVCSEPWKHPTSCEAMLPARPIPKRHAGHFIIHSFQSRNRNNIIVEMMSVK